MNLLNLNVDALFEQHNVSEIDNVHKKILSVVEDKREELRTMVGERYRDLLKAADTIAAMQKSSSTLIEQIECISSNCRRLNDQQLIGFETKDTNDFLLKRKANKELNNYFSTMMQIKLLTSLPGLIWDHIDVEKYSIAAELYIFSRHLSTGLLLDTGNPLKQQLPVAKEQWEIIKPFQHTIKQRVLVILEREELSAEVTVDCLLSLILLDKPNVNEILKNFLQLRCCAFLSCLTNTELGSGNQRRVKERILGSLKILNNTIDLLGKCFLDNGLLFQKLTENCDPSAAPTITLMSNLESAYDQYLPDIISNFRPKYEKQALNLEQVNIAINAWLAEIRRISEVQLKSLFELVPTINQIQEIKIEANKFRVQQNFKTIVEKLKLTDNLDFYALEYAPLINLRVRHILQMNWIQASEELVKYSKNILQHIDKTPKNIWLERTEDLPLSLEVALNEDQKTKSLLMKTKGYDHHIVELTTTFDEKLANIVVEMNLLLEEETAKVEDKLGLIEFLREVAQTEVHELITNLKSMQHTYKQTQELLFIVRLCVALVELCPNFKICFCQRSNWRQLTGNVLTNTTEHWNRICLLLEEEVYSFWLLILENILTEHPTVQYLPQELSHNIILEDFTSWETITLEQKDEQDNTINSTFRIPNQPRISLQSYLFTLIGYLNLTIPQTLPPKVLQTFNHKLLEHILKHYQELTRILPSTSSSVQNIALQFYFDLKFLQNIFPTSREERGITEQFQLLQNTLKDMIDPFDFELFAEKLATNVKHSVARLNCELGVLTIQTTSFLSAKTMNQSTSALIQQEKDPNILTLSSCGSTSLWFPLLPIVTPAAQNINDTKNKFTNMETDKVPSHSTTPVRKTDTTSVSKSKSGASSFFGAMSQEWFR